MWIERERGEKRERGVEQRGGRSLPWEQTTCLLSAVLLYFHLDKVKGAATLSITSAKFLQDFDVALRRKLKHKRDTFSPDCGQIDNSFLRLQNAKKRALISNSTKKQNLESLYYHGNGG